MGIRQLDFGARVALATTCALGLPALGCDQTSGYEPAGAAADGGTKADELAGGPCAQDDDCEPGWSCNDCPLGCTAADPAADPACREECGEPRCEPDGADQCGSDGVCSPSQWCNPCPAACADPTKCDACGEPRCESL